MDAAGPAPVCVGEMDVAVLTDDVRDLATGDRAFRGRGSDPPECPDRNQRAGLALADDQVSIELHRRHRELHPRSVRNQVTHLQVLQLGVDAGGRAALPGTG